MRLVQAHLPRHHDVAFQECPVSNDAIPEVVHLDRALRVGGDDPSQPRHGLGVQREVPCPTGIGVEVVTRE